MSRAKLLGSTPVTRTTSHHPADNLGGRSADGAHRLTPCDAVDDACTVPTRARRRYSSGNLLPVGQRPALASRGVHRHALGMFVITEADAAAIRATFDQGGELSAALLSPRRRFPGITDNTKARACARSIAGWMPPASPAAPDDAAASPQGRLARLPTGFPGQLRFCQDCRPRVGGRTSPVPPGHRRR